MQSTTGYPHEFVYIEVHSFLSTEAPYISLKIALDSWWAGPDFQRMYHLEIRQKGWIFLFVQRVQFMFFLMLLESLKCLPYAFYS